MTFVETAPVESGADASSGLWLAPGAQLRPSLQQPGSLQIVWGGGSGRETFETSSVELATWLMTLPTPLTRDEITASAVQTLAIDPEAAAELVDGFVEYQLLVPAGRESDGERIWSELGWDDALTMHRAVRGMRWRLELPPGAEVFTWFHDDKLVEAEVPRPPVPDEPSSDEVVLPPPGLKVFRSNLGEVMRSRRTSRNFRGTDLSLEDVGELMYWSFKPIVPGPGPRFYTSRAVSEGGRGAVAPRFLNVYTVLAPEVAGRAPWSDSGAYVFRYSPDRHAMVPVHSGEHEYQPFSKLLWNQEYADHAPALVVLTVNWDQYMWKYRSGSYYRMVHYDLGAFMQTALLVATALGLRSFVTPAIDDNRMDALLDLEHHREAAAYVVALGR